MNYIERLTTLLEHWQESIIMYLPNLLLGMVVMLLFYFIAAFFKKISYKFYKRSFKKQSQLANFISMLIYMFFILSGIFLALKSMQLENFLTKLLAGAGILGIIAGFAFKDIVSNAFSGLLIKSQRPYNTGDWVQIQNAYGVIENIGWISTAIRNQYGQLLFIPNQLVYNDIVSNFSRYKKRMIVFTAGVSYGDDLEHVKNVTLDEVKHIESVLPSEPIAFYYTNIGAYSYNFVLRFWINFTDNKQYLEAMSNCIMLIKKRYEKENISLAYPVTTLDFGVKGGVNIFDKTQNISITK